jgi:hypothetical protein
MNEQKPYIEAIRAAHYGSQTLYIRTFHADSNPSLAQHLLRCQHVSRQRAAMQSSPLHLGEARHGSHGRERYPRQRRHML